MNKEDQGEKTSQFPIIGLGASAGGLEALKEFFSQVSKDNNLAYIVQVHQSPDQPSMMPELLQKVSSVPVKKAEDGEQILPDHVYVIPPHKEISFYQGRVQLLDPVDKFTYLPIDLFFRSLAKDQGNKAVAVILSGTGSDGTVGLKEIKSYDGLVLAQSEDTAKYSSMPGSAINTGLVDMVLPPGEMPQKISQYFQFQPALKPKKTDEQKEQNWLQKIFAQIRMHLGHDFSAYKKSTILRRINRRMGLNQIQEHEDYVRFLREDPKELEALFHELLIGVTNFFRDPKSYEVLKTDILPEIFKKMGNDTVFRAWIPGCSTGEEVYSLVMVILECLDSLPKRITLQLFGTDIDKTAIDKARRGLYPASIKADVSQKRLERFFFQEGEAFRIRKEVRDCVLFSVQDVLKDPPFSRLNLLCCRNLLIYLSAEAQKKILPLFHYTLVSGGVLMLGSSETVGGFSNLFTPLNSTWKIYQKREVPPSMLQQIKFPTGVPTEVDSAKEDKALQPPEAKKSMEDLIRKAILERFAPAAVLINSKGVIHHVMGRTGKYLEQSSGPPTQNILDLAREGLSIELSSAIRQAMSSNEPILRKGIQVKMNGGFQSINLHVSPLKSPLELAGQLLVAFEDLPQAPGERKEEAEEAPEGSIDQYASRIFELEQELKNTRESHQTTIEELESSNEELKSTNEELQSSNEELKSTNEELESSKEELQSLNEELQTVNSELQSKVDELSAAQDDINNLLNSTEIATIFVDNDLRIKRFSREATRIINLIGSDIGRPLEHQASNLKYTEMLEDIKQVLEKLSPIEKEVQTRDNSWYMMRIMPYRTMDNKIQGAVLAFRDVNEQKKVQKELESLNTDLKE